MAIDATGTPTSLGIPKFNTAVDAPSGKGANAQMDAIDTLLVAMPQKPTGITTGETIVYNSGTGTWDRSSVTKLGAASLGITGVANGTKFLRDDFSWQTVPAPTFIGVERDYAQIAANATSVATTAATATAIITGANIAYNGTDVILVEFEAVSATHTVANALMQWNLYDGATDLGIICTMWETTTGGGNMHARGAMRLTPTNASHQYSIRSWSNTAGTVTTVAGAGGAGVVVPAFMRITRVA